MPLSEKPASSIELPMASKELAEIIYHDDSLEITYKVAEIRSRGSFVNYTGMPNTLQKEGMVCPERLTYVISSCDARDKYTLSLDTCTSIIAIGTDKKTGEQISIVSHQDPSEFTKKWKSDWEKDIRSSLRQIKERCATESAQCFVVGGLFFEDDKEFTTSEDMINTACRDIFGTRPTRLSEPENRTKSLHVFLSTQEKVLIVQEAKAEDISHIIGSLPE